MALQQDLAGIIKGIEDDVRTIVRGEIELVKAELLPQAKSAGIGAGLIGSAGYLAIMAGTLFFLALSFLMSAGYRAWFGLEVLPAAVLGFGTMALLLALIAGVLVLIGKPKLQLSPPESAIALAQGTRGTVTSAVKDAVQQANTLSLTGRTAEPKQPELE